MLGLCCTAVKTAEVEAEVEIIEQSKPNSQSGVLEQDLHSPTLHTQSPPHTRAFVTSFSIKAGPKGQEGSLAEEENAVTMKAVRKRYEAQAEKILLPGLASAQLQRTPSFSAGVWTSGYATRGIPAHTVSTL